MNAHTHTEPSTCPSLVYPFCSNPSTEISQVDLPYGHILRDESKDEAIRISLSDKTTPREFSNAKLG